MCGVFIVARQADGWLCAEDFAKKTVGALSWGRKSIDLSVVNTFVKRIQERYHYSLVVLKELVKTDFKLRYQGSFLGVAWSVLRVCEVLAHVGRNTDVSSCSAAWN